MGCGSKVSKGNYDKITNGMTVAEVEGIMGKGTEESAGAGAITKSLCASHMVFM